MVSLVAGCNNLVGLDKISVSDDPSLGAGSHAGGSSNGNGGVDEHGGGSNTSSGSGGMASPNGGDGGNPSGGGDTVSVAGEGGSVDLPMGDCTTNQECTDRAANDAMGLAGAAAEAEAKPSVCVKTPIPHCVQLLSDDCGTITGNYLDNSAIVIGSLFEHYCGHPEEIPASIPAGPLPVRVTDYLAGMTDRFCIRVFEQLNVPVAFAP